MSNDWTPWTIHMTDGGRFAVDQKVENGEDGLWLTSSRNGKEVRQFFNLDEVDKLIKALTDASKIRHIYDEDDTILCEFDQVGLESHGRVSLSLDRGPGFVCNKCKTMLEKWAV